jgi:hypothetical protein
LPTIRLSAIVRCGSSLRAASPGAGELRSWYNGQAIVLSRAEVEQRRMARLHDD